MSGGYVTLGELEHLTLDDVQEMHIYLEWESEERARVHAREQKKAEAQEEARRRGGVKGR